MGGASSMWPHENGLLAMAHVIG
ncbi:uncharacterized protein G2W53_039005 [Senna tora]|uniref:Uncharacterized protein n=1 Tax=Senna tora TaxID=362788 RepID=A0A834SMQ1_9FABA|nr:uncharacterized protein G2W53_039005 [Senna tora]